MLIQQYYANHGYPDAQVTSAVAEYDAKRNGYFITYTIVEGDALHVRQDRRSRPRIAGLDANTPDQHHPDAPGRSLLGRPICRRRRRTWRSKPPTWAIHLPTCVRVSTVTRRPATFNITYLVDKGQHVYVERINITGNTKTRDFVIRRELDFAEGDPFSRALITQARPHIEALGLLLEGRYQRRAGQCARQGHPQYRRDRAVDRRLRRDGWVTTALRASWANCRSPSATSSAAASTCKALGRCEPDWQELRLLVHRALLHGPQDVGGHRRLPPHRGRDVDQHLRHDHDRRAVALRPAGHPRCDGAALHRPRPDDHRRRQSAPTLDVLRQRADRSTRRGSATA